MFTNSKSISKNDSLKWFSIIWGVSIIAPLVYFPCPSLLTGHPWKVELVMSFILFVSLSSYLFVQQKRQYAVSISPQIVSHIIIPCSAFILWSALSVFWADSLYSVLHHTLVWSGYLIFFFFALHIVSDKKLFKAGMLTLGSVISIICLCCVLEFVFEENINATFGFRYGRYAEIFAALLPLFFSFVLQLNRKYLWLTVFATACLWLGLLFAMSRGALFSSIVGVSVFILLRIFSNKTFTEKRRLIFAVIGLIFICLLTQISFFSTGSAQKTAVFSRISIHSEKDPSNSFSQNVRFLFAGVGKEMFFEHKLIGVGADNFGLEFNKYRAVFSENAANKGSAQQQEEYLPERAHNEYLQILAELGIVGGIIILWFLGGIAKLGLTEIVKKRFERGNILTHSAIGGIAAFLVSSLFSSFSFRLMQNGLVFFFLLAILLRNFAVKRNQDRQKRLFITPPLKMAFGLTALTACLSLTVFSSLKAASQYFVYQAEGQKNFEKAESYYRTAILLDPANASADFLYGLRLLDEGNYQTSAEQLEQAVRKGVNDSVSYSYLISAQTLADHPQQALKTASEAVRIFPYSVFIRVRYAALLNAAREQIESANELEIAQNLNEKQAKTWWLLINDGSLKTSQESRVNKEISSLEDLAPNQGVYAILAERNIVYPNEKTKFNF